MSRGIAEPQFRGDVWKREPRRDLPAFGEALPQLGSRDVQRARALGHFVFRNIGVPFRQVNHHVKRDDGDAEFLSVRPQQLLRSIRVVKGLTGSIAAGAGVVAPHDEMAAPVVFSNDRVPESFLWPRHAHGQWQQGKHDRIFLILAKECLIASNPDVVFHVPGPGHSYTGMNEKTCLNFLGSPQREFLVRSMHRIPRLESDHTAPTASNKYLP